MGKGQKLDKCIDHVSEVTGLPFWIAKLEMADEAGVNALSDLTEEDMDKMISLFEKYYPNVVK